MDIPCSVEVIILDRDRKPWMTGSIPLVVDGDLQSAIKAGKEEVRKQREIASRNNTSIEEAWLVIKL